MVNQIGSLIVNEDQQPLIHPNYVDHDSEEDIQLAPGSMISKIFGVIFAPFTWCCSITSVRPREQVVNSYWNVPRDIIVKPGLYWTSCCGLSQKRVSTAIQDVKISSWKVNDKDGNPIKISAVIQWKVDDAKKYAFDANSNASQLLYDQALATVREIACRYPFDSELEHTECLRKPTAHMSHELSDDLQKRTNQLGVKILSFTLTDIIYSEEVQKMLLARQEAKAHVNARQVFAEGMADTAVKTVNRIEEQSEIKYTPEEKRQLISNLVLELSNPSSSGSVNLFLNSGGLPNSFHSNQK